MSQSIVGFDACAAELERLLDHASQVLEAARGRNDDEVTDSIVAAGSAFVDFKRRSEPESFSDTQEVRRVAELDRIADDARRNLMSASIADAAKGILDRTSELASLVKQVRGEVAQNDKREQRLRLLPVRSAIDALTDTMESLKDVRRELRSDNEDEQAIASAITRLVNTAKSLRERLDGLSDE